ATKARLAKSDRELAFALVNDTIVLAPYRQAALWLKADGVWTLSGVVQVDANVPYTHWLDQVAAFLNAKGLQESYAFTAADLPSHLSVEWQNWWPEHGLWLGSSQQKIKGAAVFLREEVWQPDDIEKLNEWLEIWWHAFSSLYSERIVKLRGLPERIKNLLAPIEGRTWWKQKRLHILLFISIFLLFPVRLTVLAPGELVSANPVVIRAPLDGVIDVFHVQPNQQVAADQVLFSFDELVIQSKIKVASQALATAKTDYRQTSQLALFESKSKTQLGLMIGKVEERRVEVGALQEQLSRARVAAPKAGVVLMDDPSEWIGKPVAIGERILRIASLDDMEVEAWVPLADAINLKPGDSVTLYLSASPLSPVSASVRYMSHDAVQRADGNFAYRIRAKLEEPSQHRVGLKGTAKVHGAWVPFVFWMMRRPIATLRAYVGW
ncbi:HlyD family efflux transporter periplasmic adaptor subunit, partial [Limnohabitans sp. Rim8]|uniref:efflux RND transporter periplasmic adaptor subunit n=1 Tax=Limnohabitans sp. Rim8 TaxID=1100718 RepID=UPI0026257F04